jgi:hypothetical protein
MFDSRVGRSRRVKSLAKGGFGVRSKSSQGNGFQLLTAISQPVTVDSVQDRVMEG